MPFSFSIIDYPFIYLCLQIVFLKGPIGLCKTLNVAVIILAASNSVAILVRLGACVVSIKE
jgi:hypothetical protein